VTRTKRKIPADAAWPPAGVRDLKPDIPVNNRADRVRFPTLREALERDGLKQAPPATQIRSAPPRHATLAQQLVPDTRTQQIVLDLCDRCCREHEIHVDVELSDGRSANTGSGCAKGESMEIQARLKRAVSVAKTRSKLRGELALVHDEHARASQAWKEVEELQAPIAVLLEEIPVSTGVRQIWGMDDARVWTVPGSNQGFDTERRQALLSAWRGNRYRARGFETTPYSYMQRAKALEDRLAKIESKLGSLLF